MLAAQRGSIADAAPVFAALGMRRLALSPGLSGGGPLSTFA